MFAARAMVENSDAMSFRLLARNRHRIRRAHAAEFFVPVFCVGKVIPPTRDELLIDRTPVLDFFDPIKTGESPCNRQPRRHRKLLPNRIVGLETIGARSRRRPCPGGPAKSLVCQNDAAALRAFIRTWPRAD